MNRPPLAKARLAALEALRRAGPWVASARAQYGEIGRRRGVRRALDPDGPGASFGPYPTHVRMCFSAVPPERTLRGVDVLARLLGR